jgi:hypothetical protein
MNYFRIQISNLVARWTLAWQSTVTQINLRPLFWETKFLKIISNKNTIKYVGIVVPGRVPTEAIKTSGYSLSSMGKAARNSFYEYLEVMCCHKHDVEYETTRSGCATGVSLEDAKNRAWRELVERDSFLMHFLCPDLMTTPVDPPREFSGAGIRCAELQSIDQKVVVVIAVKQFEGWTCIGLGASSHRNEAKLKACMECEVLGSEWVLQTNNIDPNSKRQAFAQHWFAAQSDLVKIRIEGMLSGAGSEAIDFTIAPDSSVVDFVEPFPTGVDLKSANSVCIRLTNNSLIPMSIGKSWEKSRDKVLGLLGDRNLKGQWATHPFL